MDQEKRKKNNSNTFKKGFSLLEVIVAVFIFVLVVSAASMTFINAIKGYDNAKTIQRDLEGAQQAMNIMAKTLRTSSIVDDSQLPSRLDIYDYSQGRCIVYAFVGNTLQYGSIGSADKATCNFGTISLSEMLPTFVTGSFDAVMSTSTPSFVGKATISMEVCHPDGCGVTYIDKAIIQTTVSLRDYVESGI